MAVLDHELIDLVSGQLQLTYASTVHYPLVHIYWYTITCNMWWWCLTFHCCHTTHTVHLHRSN